MFKTIGGRRFFFKFRAGIYKEIKRTRKESNCIPANLSHYSYLGFPVIDNNADINIAVWPRLSIRIRAEQNYLSSIHSLVNQSGDFFSFFIHKPMIFTENAFVK
jgi:hypothetical protein